MRQLHVVMPDGIDDPWHPSGGNVYDRRACRGLRELGWSVHEHTVPGPWHRADAAVTRPAGISPALPGPAGISLAGISPAMPGPAGSDSRDADPLGADRARTDPAASAALAATLARVPDRGVVLIDGLVASLVPEVLEPEADRLRLVVLVHMPRDDPREVAALSTACAIVATSQWTRQWLCENYGLPAGRVHVVRPGVDAAELAAGTPSGERLLCVGAVTPVKGQDVLLDALARVDALAVVEGHTGADSGARLNAPAGLNVAAGLDAPAGGDAQEGVDKPEGGDAQGRVDAPARIDTAPWRCVVVGSLDVNARFAAGVRRQSEDAGFGARVRFTGALSGAELDDAYQEVDVLVMASRAETYGMVISEALARGLPVIATNVGGVPEALGRVSDGTRPGLLVPPDDVDSLAGALRQWLGDPEERRRLRAAARSRRRTLGGWPTACRELSAVLAAVAGSAVPAAPLLSGPSE